MTQEEKQLLLVDLCARIPYSQIVNINGEIKKLIVISNTFIHFADLTDDDLEGICDLDYCDVKPYLRPMSSMTEEEKKKVCSLNGISLIELNERLKWDMYIKVYTIETFDYFNAHHLDYRGLIEKGLAIEAPKEMYK